MYNSIMNIVNFINIIKVQVHKIKPYNKMFFYIRQS